MTYTQYSGRFGLSFLFQILLAPERSLSLQVPRLYTCNPTSMGKHDDKALWWQSWNNDSILQNYIARLQISSNCHRAEPRTEVQIPGAVLWRPAEKHSSTFRCTNVECNFPYRAKYALFPWQHRTSTPGNYAHGPQRASAKREGALKLAPSARALTSFLALYPYVLRTTSSSVYLQTSSPHVCPSLASTGIRLLDR